MTYRIRELEWRYSGAAYGYLADGISHYKIGFLNNYLIIDGKGTREYGNVEEAKAAAQAHHEQQLMKWLTPEHEPRTLMEYDKEAHAYYFRPPLRMSPPYLKQIVVEAIVDVAKDGSFGELEVIDTKMPKPFVENFKDKLHD